MRRWLSPPVAFALAAAAMWWIARNAGWGRFSFPGQPLLGFGLIALGVAVIIVSLWFFARVRTTPNPMQPARASALVTTGPYQLSRNPMYVGDAIALIGVGVWLGSVPALLVVAAFVLYIDRLQIVREEKVLTGIFGERYTEYRRRVRRWL